MRMFNLRQGANSERWVIHQPEGLPEGSRHVCTFMKGIVHYSIVYFGALLYNTRRSSLAGSALVPLGHALRQFPLWETHTHISSCAPRSVSWRCDKGYQQHHSVPCSVRSAPVARSTWDAHIVMTLHKCISYIVFLQTNWVNDHLDLDFTYIL